MGLTLRELILLLALASGAAAPPALAIEVDDPDGNPVRQPASIEPQQMTPMMREMGAIHEVQLESAAKLGERMIGFEDRVFEKMQGDAIQNPSNGSAPMQRPQLGGGP